MPSIFWGGDTRDQAGGRMQTMLKNSGKWLPRIAVASAITVYFLIIFGSHVRVTDSGMGCPDWPLCKGSLNPAQGFHAFMEQMHRYFAGSASILVILTAIIAKRSKAQPAAIRPAIVTCFIIFIQVILGAVTVYDGNGAPTVAGHLLAGLALLAGATITAVASLVPKVNLVGRRLSPISWIAVTAAGLLYISGSLIVNADAEKYCARFPLCPTGISNRYVALHLAHRSMVLIASIALITFAVHAWRSWSSHRAVRPLAGSIILILLSTAVLGIFSALLKAPAHLQDLHLAGAAAVLLVTVALAAVGWFLAADAQEI